MFLLNCGLVHPFGGRARSPRHYLEMHRALYRKGKSLCNGYPLRYFFGGGGLTGSDLFQAPPQRGPRGLEI
jgi:hypothetical protein